MKIIINSDDFGMDANRTKAISEAFDRGLTTTTTAMANMPWFEKAMGIARSKNLLDRVGLHFCITEGFPLTNQMRECSEFCNESGEFTKQFHQSLKGRLWLPKPASEAIAVEAHAQIRRYLDCGGRMMHIDSHHHAHTDFSVARILLPIAKSYGFKSCRMSRNLATYKGALKSVYKSMYNTYAARQLPFMVKYFTDFQGFKASYRQLSAETTVEVMIHPLYRNKEGVIDVSGDLMDLRIPMSEEIAFWDAVKNDGIRVASISDCDMPC